jgi:hypothetical protein
MHVDDNLLDVYRYANSKWGLDFDYSKLKSMTPDKIKSISPNIVKEMSTSMEKGIKNKIKSEEGNREKRITITENTQDLVREIISEIAKESLETENVTEMNQLYPEQQEAEPIVQEKQSPTQPYAPSNKDLQKYREYQFANSLAGGIGITPDQVPALQQQGYVVEPIPNSKLYKITQFPEWAVKQEVPIQ